VSGQLGVSALIEWLRDRVAEARGSTLADGTRRLETDAESVQILTVHRSKGLQFPIVYLPEAWDHHVPGTDEGSVLRLHATAGSDQEPPGGHGEATIGRSLERVLDVGGASGPGRLERLTQCRQEEAGEELRLFYVALTRAQCQVITWWAASANTKASALHRLLNARERGDVEPAAHYPVARDPLTARGLDPGFSLERVEARTPTTWQQSSESPPHLRARAFVRQLDLAWRRTSYSALTAAAHGLDLSSAAVGSEPESVKEDDETALPADAGGVLDPGVPAPPGDDANPAGWDLPSPMADLPSGATFGTAVHAIFESVDFASDDLLGALRTAAAGELSRSAASSMTAESLAQGLLPIFDTPLGPLADQRRLRDVERRDQLPELTFELPLGGGAEVHGEVVLGQVAPLLRRHLAASDPLAAYSDLVEHPALAEQPLRGYLTGSIDAVLRMHSTIGEPRYLVVDYKTNWLGNGNDEVLTLGHYAPPRLAAAMMQAHYPLQALLYSVAVHRMLRWRQPGYDPGRHLGGVLYLFLRGMGGAETPTVGGVPCGVFSWLPSAALITDLSDLLDGSRA
jgi:exodeoxyribonuclease V beta subunit